MATPTPMMMGGGATPLYHMPMEDPATKQMVPPQLEGLPDMKPEDMAFFGKLLQDAEDAELSVEEAKERKIMKLLLKVGRSELAAAGVGVGVGVCGWVLVWDGG